jgi:diguanylate cyclase (GGDEF)-like protein/PAS domain S-box-containing protein
MDNRMNVAPCGFLTLTAQGIIKEVNQTFTQMTGFESAELLDKHIESFLPMASKIMFHSLFLPQIQLNGCIEELYLIFKDKNGEEIPVLLMGSRCEANNNELIDCVIIRMRKRDDYERELQNIKKKLEDAYMIETNLRKLFETTLFSINEGIIVTDNEGKITIMNSLAEEYTGWVKENALGQKFHAVFHGIHSKTREEESDIVQKILDTEGKNDVFDETILVSKSEEERYVSGTVASMKSKDGKVLGVVTSFRDITKEYLQEKEIDSFLNVNMEMLCVIDEDGNYHKINKKFETILGYTIEELFGKSYIAFVHKDDVTDTLDIIRESNEASELTVITNRYLCKDGTYKYIEWYRQPVAGKYTYATARDVTEKVKKEEQLLKIAGKDELTGLYNRHYLNSYLESEIEKAESVNTPISMAILDLDHFKLVNDTWGHPVGDEQLKHTAHTVLKVIRKTDLMIRFGGEEFIIIMPQTDVNSSQIILEKVRAAIENNPLAITGRQTVSIGTAQRMKKEIFSDWYKRVDEALYRAKEDGRNRIVASLTA